MNINYYINIVILKISNGGIIKNSINNLKRYITVYKRGVTYGRKNRKSIASWS